MNRRSFLRGVIASCVAPALLLPKTASIPKWKRTTQQLWVPNPEWKTAEYEIAWLASPNLVKYLAQNEVQKQQEALNEYIKCGIDLWLSPSQLV